MDTTENNTIKLHGMASVCQMIERIREMPKAQIKRIELQEERARIELSDEDLLELYHQFDKEWCIPTYDRSIQITGEYKEREFEITINLPGFVTEVIIPRWKREFLGKLQPGKRKRNERQNNRNQHR